MASPISYLALARLVRAGTLFSPGADVVAGLCLAEQPWTLAAARAVVASILLYAAGMVLNDHADRELDARLRPERPIPRGDVTAGFALKSGLVLMAVALITSPVPWHHGAMAMLVLLYKFSVAPDLRYSASLSSSRGVSTTPCAAAFSEILEARAW